MSIFHWMLLGHKTVVSYKTVQSFCSDVAVQNVNVTSSPICKVLCFKIHQLVLPINKIIFIITTITTITIIIIIIIFNFNITIIIIIIIITIIIESTIVIIIILSFVLHFFNIIGSCVTFIFEFICAFLTTSFLLFIGFRCNILLSNISIDLLLLALAFVKNVSTFNKQFSEKLSCAIALTVDWC